jgi:hypothetical protein
MSKLCEATILQIVVYGCPDTFCSDKYIEYKSSRDSQFIFQYTMSGCMDQANMESRIEIPE